MQAVADVKVVPVAEALIALDNARVDVKEDVLEAAVLHALDVLEVAEATVPPLAVLDALQDVQRLVEDVPGAPDALADAILHVRVAPKIAMEHV